MRTQGKGDRGSRAGADPSPGKRRRAEDLDPQIVTAYTDQNILLALFEGLTAIDEKTSLAVPAAAKSWESSPDGLVWTFHLRDGLRWSNGEPLMADDFIQSWRRLLSPAIASEFADLLYPIKNAQAFNEGSVSDPGVLGISAPDVRTIRIELERPTPYLPILVALPSWYPVNPRVLDRFGAMAKRATDWTAPGTSSATGPSPSRSGRPTRGSWSPRTRTTGTPTTVTLQQIVFFPNDSPRR